jgi:ubiquinone/menaquinone biosynthesis C-methylase UbiE
MGAVFLSHVLEHLPTTTLAKQALEEMNRVAEGVFIVYPSKQSIAAWIIPEHHLWVWREGTAMHLEQRRIPGNKERIIVETAGKAV